MTARAMRIAQVAPLAGSVPPKQYGGTERVVSWLTEELVRQGHEVTLFATGDSVTSAELVACFEQALRFDPEATCAIPPSPRHAERGLSACLGVPHHSLHRLSAFPLFRRRATNTLTTLRSARSAVSRAGVLGVPGNAAGLHLERPAKPLAWANWTSTVYHGLPGDLLPARRDPSLDYLAFLGRISPGEAGRPRDRDRARTG